MLSTAYFFLVFGGIAYFIGLCWIFYLDLSMKHNPTSDEQGQSSKAAWAVIMAVVGIIVAAIAGVFIIMTTSV